MSPYPTERGVAVDSQTELAFSVDKQPKAFCYEGKDQAAFHVWDKMKGAGRLPATVSHQ